MTNSIKTFFLIVFVVYLTLMLIFSLNILPRYGPKEGLSLVNDNSILETTNAYGTTQPYTSHKLQNWENCVQQGYPKMFCMTMPYPNAAVE